MKANEGYLLNQVFSVVIVVLLGIIFYILAASGLASGTINTMVASLLLIIISILCVAMLSEITKISCMLSKRK